MKTVISKLTELVGHHVLDWVPRLDVRHPFDPDASGIAFGLDGVTYFVFEDPSDGYRSSAASPMVFDGSITDIGYGGQYPEHLKWSVVVSHREKYHVVEDYEGQPCGESDVIEFRLQSTNELILSVGTENTDDYYPYFVAQWTPPKD